MANNIFAMPTFPAASAAPWTAMTPQAMATSTLGMPAMMDQTSLSKEAMQTMQCQPFMSSPEQFGKIESLLQKASNQLLEFVQKVLEWVTKNGNNAFANIPGMNQDGGANAGSAINADALKGSSAFGKSLAADAFKNADGPGGWCFKWVSEALGRHGVSCRGASAYMAADQLAKNGKFNEVKGLSREQLKKLPAGAIVVWHHAPGHPHGHISIADGNGREASDKIRPQTTSYPSTFRVFMPK